MNCAHLITGNGCLSNRSRILLPQIVLLLLYRFLPLCGGFRLWLHHLRRFDLFGAISCKMPVASAPRAKNMQSLICYLILVSFEPNFAYHRLSKINLNTYTSKTSSFYLKSVLVHPNGLSNSRSHGKQKTFTIVYQIQTQKPDLEYVQPWRLEPQNQDSKLWLLNNDRRSSMVPLSLPILDPALNQTWPCNSHYPRPWYRILHFVSKASWDDPSSRCSPPSCPGALHLTHPAMGNTTLGTPFRSISTLVIDCDQLFFNEISTFPHWWHLLIT